jgi:hypothetical protein
VAFHQNKSVILRELSEYAARVVRAATITVSESKDLRFHPFVQTKTVIQSEASEFVAPAFGATINKESESKA